MKLENSNFRRGHVGERINPEEITELYLGLAMEKADRDSICSAARAVNRDIAIFAARRNPDGKLGFDRV